MTKRRKGNHWTAAVPIAATLVAAMAACSPTKYVPDGELLLKGYSVKSDKKSFEASRLASCVSQQPNSKWFSSIKVPLGIYDLSGRDTTRWINRVLKRLGEPPVIYDSLAAEASCRAMETTMRADGYLDGKASFSLLRKGKSGRLLFEVSPGRAYVIDSVAYDIDDEEIARELRVDKPQNRGLKRGMTFSRGNLEQERKRITQILTNRGYYKFNGDFIRYEADSLGKDGRVDVLLHLVKYRPNNNSPEMEHQRFAIDTVVFRSSDGHKLPLRRHVLENNTFIEPGQPFSASDLQRTYNNFARLQAVRFTNIHFDERPDTPTLGCDIQVSTRRPNSLSFQPEGTNTAGDLGAAASLTYENYNLFRGSEVFSVQLRGAFEAIKGLDGYQNQNYEEYGVETKLVFPRMIAPFVSRAYRRRSTMQSELLFSYNLQNRPEFHRRVLTSSWRYHWKNSSGKKSYRLDLIDMNYVYMPWISLTFKNDYLDNVTNRNAILRYNYENLFILRTGLNIAYNDGTNAIRSNFEIGGNFLDLVSHALHSRRNDIGQYTLFNIAFAQYLKGDFDYTHLFHIDSRNILAMHIALGVAYPYGNSQVLPFEKRYFSGGANSVRGWNVRGLGPGKFHGTDGRIDFINQTGDMKLDMNLELRTYLFWKFNGAAFIDAGNVWTIKDYKDQPGGQFRFNEFYKQIAMAYGLGLRLNLDYFVMRLDFGMKAINPAYSDGERHYPIAHPDFGRDLSVHFAVGMPF